MINDHDHNEQVHIFETKITRLYFIPRAIKHDQAQLCYHHIVLSTIVMVVTNCR